MENWTGWQVDDFVTKWREPVESLLMQTEALVVESCRGIIAHHVKGCVRLAAQFKAEVQSLLEHHAFRATCFRP